MSLRPLRPASATASVQTRPPVTRGRSSPVAGTAGLALLTLLCGCGGGGGGGQAAPPASTNANLSGLSISTGTLSPAFSASITNYTVGPAQLDSTVVITPTAADSGATIFVEGVPVASGSASSPISLPVGQTPVLVGVRAADNNTLRLYNIVFDRTPQANANDECTNPLALTLGQQSFSTLNATTNQPWTCGPGANDIWFSFDAPNVGTYTFDTCGSSFDTVLELLTAGCNPLQILECDDDTCGTGSSIDAITVTPGTSFLLRVGGLGGATGAGVLNVTETLPPVLPDVCADALPVTLGLIAFDTTTATQSSPAFNCVNPNAAGPDLWYSFVAPNTQTYVVETCQDTTFDTVLELYSGTCAALSVLQCNDDGCNVQSRITFQATAGDSFLFRVAGFGGATGSGILTVREEDMVFNPANDNFYQAITGSFNWDGANLDAQAQIFNNTPGHLVTITSQDEVTFVAGGPLDRFWMGLFQDPNDPNFSEPGGGWTWVTGEAFAFDNWGVGEPNNLGPGGASEDFAEVIIDDTWNDNINSAGPTQGYVVEWEVSGPMGGPRLAGPQRPTSDDARDDVVAMSGPLALDAIDPLRMRGTWDRVHASGARAQGASGHISGGHALAVGSNFQPGQFGSIIGQNLCPADVNSSGRPARLFAQGSDLAEDNDLTLLAEHLPEEAVALFLVSPAPGSGSRPVMQGDLCIDMTRVGRFGTALGGGPALGLVVDLSAVPTSAGVESLQPGDVRHFQAWFRDGGHSSGFTNAVSVTFR